MDAMQINRLSLIDFKNNTNTDLNILGILGSADEAEKRNGDPYYRLSLMDKDCSLLVMKWETNDIDFETLKNNVGQVCVIQGKTRPYEKSPAGFSFHASNIYFLNDEQLNGLNLTITDFYNIIENRDSLVLDLSDYLNSINNTYYGKLASQALLNNWDIFVNTAAGKSMHHTAVGGLLQHSVEVIKLADGTYCACKQLGYNNLNRALIIAGAAIHDIGKVKEIKTEQSGASDYTENSVLASHSIIGIQLLTEAAVQLNLQNSREYEELCHIIASHHGRIEWGCLKEPALIEALIISQADLMSGTINAVDKNIVNVQAGEQFVAFGNKWLKSIGALHDEIIIE